ncbi:MAG: GNAT family N-acetyltransferase [Christensenellales bacterium]
MKHQGTVILNTPRLRLRPYLPDDAETMFRNWANDPRVTAFLTWAPHESLEVTRQLISAWVESYQSDTVYRWGITLDGELIGDISVVRWRDQDEECEIGYCLGRNWWHQGLMTEALCSVMRYLFESVGFHRITLRHDSANPASGRVMQKAGLHHEGCLREAIKRRDGSFADVQVYGAIKGQWQAPTEEENRP